MSHHSDRGSILAMLEYGRSGRTKVEEAFIARFIAPLPDASRDIFNNWHVIRGDSPIIWSVHTDTVHHSACMQTLHVDPVSDIVGLSRRAKRYASCLGADDTAGVWLAIELIKAGVAGHYIFHTEEESGGIGSSSIALDAPELLAGAQFAIALDRMGTSDIITHQFGGRCASDTFAESLASQLNVNGLKYSTSSHGTFTDTANYVDAIGECTNLSVGYYHAHTPNEVLDLRHLFALRDALVGIDVEALVASRQPGEYDRESVTRWSGMSAFYGTTISQRPVYAYEADEYCDECSGRYFPSESNAHAPHKFCDRDCEDIFMDTQSWLNGDYGRVVKILGVM